jgi:magnesium chelatase subunit I
LRCLLLEEKKLVPRITDIEATFPAIMGKLELEYGGQDKKAAEIVEDLAKRAIKVVFDERFALDGLSSIVESFNNGIGAEVSQLIPSEEYMDGLNNVPGLREAVASLCNTEDPAETSSAIEFILEGLHLSNKLNRETHEGTIVYKEHTESFEPDLKETTKL